MSGIDDGVPWAGGYASREPLFRRACEVIVGTKPIDAVVYGTDAAGKRVEVGKSPQFVQTVPDALRISGLRVVFRIELTGKKDPNTARVEIYNLSAASRATLKDKGVRLVLQAGYLGGLAQIFSGDARTCEHKHLGPDIVTTVQCGDGERAFKFADYSKSFRPGTSVRDIVKSVAKTLGVDPGNAERQAQKLTSQYVNAFTASGRASDVLEQVLEPHGYGYSIQGGRLEILKPTEWLDTEGPRLDRDSGLVGAPEWGAPEAKGKPSILKVRSLIQPLFRPGIRFELAALEVKGFFRCGKVTHNGDTDGGEWFTDVEATPAQ